MTSALFFACNEHDKAFLQQHPIEGVDYHFVDFDINSPQLRAIPNLPDYTIISVFAHAQSVDNSQFDMFPNLKMIVTRSTGYNHIDLDYCKQRNITVCNVPNYGATTVAEFTIGVMLGLMRRIPLAKSQMKTNSVYLPNYVGDNISGKTVGVIGTGAIGRGVIRILQAFDAKIIAYDPYPSQALLNQGVYYVKELEELYEKSDIITLHCPATDRNFHLLDALAFSRMKRGVYIINTARGSLIDTEALYAALKSGIVGGAALDVLENEDVITEREFSTDMEKKPTDFLIDSVINFKMLQLNNTLITPHIAFNSIDAVQQILTTTVNNIQGFLAGKPQNVVSK